MKPLYNVWDALPEGQRHMVEYDPEADSAGGEQVTNDRRTQAHTRSCTRTRT